MIKTHKNIRNVIGELLTSEDINQNLLEVLKKNSNINYKDIEKSLLQIFEKDYKSAPDSIPDSALKVKKNLNYNINYSKLVEKILDKNGEFITELRLYKLLETIIINTQFLLGLDKFKLAFLKQKKGLSERTYLIAKAPFYYPDAVRQEVRVYVKKNGYELHEIEDGKKIEEFESDNQVIEQARKQLISSMHSSIDLSLNQFHDLRENLTYDSNIVKLYNQLFNKKKDN